MFDQICPLLTKKPARIACLSRRVNSLVNNKHFPCPSPRHGGHTYSELCWILLKLGGCSNWLWAQLLSLKLYTASIVCRIFGSVGLRFPGKFKKPKESPILPLGTETPSQWLLLNFCYGEFWLALSQGRRSSNTCWALRSDEVGGRKRIVRRRILGNY